ncbi:LicD family protein [Enterococcus sp. DIV0187]|uniref:LicD family protein n=1 Tax=Enterococcus sp. DIV0187 TaxID=2774644 RepID=UPI003F256ACB
MIEEEYLSLEELHNELLNILFEVDRLCKIHGITYFLSGGTLLGAIRDKGFIPWDDDLDIMMLREDYEKFICVSSELPHPYRACSLKNMSDWSYPFIKIENTQTYVEDEYRHIQHGAFLDIFPIERIPSIDKKQKTIIRKMKILDLLRGTGTKKKFKPAEKYRFIKRLITPYANYKGANYFANKMNDFAKKVDQENRNSEINGVILATAYGTREFVPKEVFEKTIEVNFESFATLVPQGYNVYLSQLYGDYMKYPPKEQQVPAHFKIKRRRR